MSLLQNTLGMEPFLKLNRITFQDTGGRQQRVGCPYSSAFATQMVFCCIRPIIQATKSFSLCSSINSMCFMNGTVGVK